MKTVSCRFAIFFLTTSPATPVIYSIKFLILNFLSVDFLAPKTGYCCENQPVLGPWSLGVGRGSGISLSVTREGFMQSSHSHKSDRFSLNGFSQKSNQN